jgi:hypothetical protein
MNAAVVFFESTFLVVMIVNFLTEYVPEGEIIPVRDFLKQAKRYIKNEGFMMEFIPLIPVSFFVDTSK